MDYGYPLAANVFRAKGAASTLQIDPVRKAVPNTEKLTSGASFMSEKPVNIDAIIKKHVPREET